MLELPEPDDPPLLPEPEPPMLELPVLPPPLEPLEPPEPLLPEVPVVLESELPLRPEPLVLPPMPEPLLVPPMPDVPDVPPAPDEEPLLMPAPPLPLPEEPEDCATAEPASANADTRTARANFFMSTPSPMVGLKPHSRGAFNVDQTEAAFRRTSAEIRVGRMMQTR